MRYSCLLSLLPASLLLGACAGTRPATRSGFLGIGRLNGYDRHDHAQGRWRTHYDAAQTQPYTAGRYRHGRPVRTFRYYAPAGALDHSEQYGRAGFCEVTYWHPGGQVARQGKAQWVTGPEGSRFYWFGPWTSYAENGQITAVQTYAAGNLTRTEAYAAGQLALVETYENKKLTRVETYSDGKLNKVETLENGRVVSTTNSL